MPETYSNASSELSGTISSADLSRTDGAPDVVPGGPMRRRADGARSGDARGRRRARTVRKLLDTDRRSSGRLMCDRLDVPKSVHVRRLAHEPRVRKTCAESLA